MGWVGFSFLPSHVGRARRRCNHSGAGAANHKVCPKSSTPPAREQDLPGKAASLPPGMVPSSGSPLALLSKPGSLCHHTACCVQGWWRHGLSGTSPLGVVAPKTPSPTWGLLSPQSLVAGRVTRDAAACLPRAFARHLLRPLSGTVTGREGPLPGAQPGAPK